MQFLRSADAQPGIQALAQQLVERLSAGERVLWLLSGGSNVGYSIAILQAIPPVLARGLVIGLVDERYGPVGHPDSNFAQLQAAGFEAPASTVIPVLKSGLSLEQTAQAYEAALATALQDCQSSFAQVGIGADGHVAGMLPHSPVLGESQRLVASYRSQPYERITITVPALQRLTAIYAFAFGADKRPTLERLHNSQLSPEEQPAQLLKTFTDVYLYNDIVGD